MHSEINSKSLFSSSTEMLGSFTTEKRDFNCEANFPHRKISEILPLHSGIIVVVLSNK